MSKEKLDTLVSSIRSKKSYPDPHKEFAERSQLLRWFHERTSKELKAMKAALLTHKGGAK